MTTTMRVPVWTLLDDDRCYQWLLAYLHPDGLGCPDGHPLPADQAPHDRHRAPLVDYECRQCGRVFNLFSATLLNGVRFPCAKIVLMLQGFWKGVPTTQLADELGVAYRNLLRWRHDLHEAVAERFPPLAVTRPDDRGRRDVSERRRERPPASGARGSTAPARQQGARPRDVRQRPTADRRRGGS